MDYNILEELQYGVDETGVQPGGGPQERVIGPKGKKYNISNRLETGRELLLL